MMENTLFNKMFLFSNRITALTIAFTKMTVFRPSRCLADILVLRKSCQASKNASPSRPLMQQLQQEIQQPYKVSPKNPTVVQFPMLPCRFDFVIA